VQQILTRNTLRKKYSIYACRTHSDSRGEVRNATAHTAGLTINSEVTFCHHYPTHDLHTGSTGNNGITKHYEPILFSAVGIATRYGVEGPGIESRDFPHLSRPAVGGIGSFPGVKWPKRGVYHPPHLAPRLKKE